MKELLKLVPDVTTFAANVVVFLAAVGAAVAGALAAVKKIKEAWVDTNKPVATESLGTQVIGGLLQDMYGSAMMSEKLRDNTKAVEDLCDELRETRGEVRRLIDRMDRRHD